MPTECLLVRLAADSNFGAFSKLGADIELLSIELESPSLCWFPLPEDQPVDHKGMVVLPSPFDRVYPANGQRLKVGWLSLPIQSIQSDRAGNSEARLGCISCVKLHFVV